MANFKCGEIFIGLVIRVYKCILKPTQSKYWVPITQKMIEDLSANSTGWSILLDL